MAAARKRRCAPAVSVATVETREFVETVLVTGSLVPRDEILVSPEIEGLRVLELKVDEGDLVKKGQVLATLVANRSMPRSPRTTPSSPARTRPSPRPRARSSRPKPAPRRPVHRSTAREPLKKNGWIADSTLDQRESAASSTKAQVVGRRATA